MLSKLDPTPAARKRAKRPSKAQQAARAGAANARKAREAHRVDLDGLARATFAEYALREWTDEDRYRCRLQLRLDIPPPLVPGRRGVPLPPLTETEQTERRTQLERAEKEARELSRKLRDAWRRARTFALRADVVAAAQDERLLRFPSLYSLTRLLQSAPAWLDPPLPQRQPTQINARTKLVEHLSRHDVFSLRETHALPKRRPLDLLIIRAPDAKQLAAISILAGIGPPAGGRTAAESLKSETNLIRPLWRRFFEVVRLGT